MEIRRAHVTYNGVLAYFNTLVKSFLENCTTVNLFSLSSREKNNCKCVVCVLCSVLCSVVCVLCSVLCSVVCVVCVCVVV